MRLYCLSYLIIHITCYVRLIGSLVIYLMSTALFDIRPLETVTAPVGWRWESNWKIVVNDRTDPEG